MLDEDFLMGLARVTVFALMLLNGVLGELLIIT
jgi:hypothetical protein